MKLENMLGYFIIRWFHYSWMMLTIGSVNFCSCAPLKYKKYTIISPNITLISYYLLDKKCLISLIENYFYPEMCPNAYDPVTDYGILITFWCCLGSNILYFEVMSPLICNLIFVAGIWTIYSLNTTLLPT